MPLNTKIFLPLLKGLRALSRIRLPGSTLPLVSWVILDIPLIFLSVKGHNSISTSLLKDSEMVCYKHLRHSRHHPTHQKVSYSLLINFGRVLMTELDIHTLELVSQNIAPVLET